MPSAAYLLPLLLVHLFTGKGATAYARDCVVDSTYTVPCEGVEAPVPCECGCGSPCLDTSDAPEGLMAVVLRPHELDWSEPTTMCPVPHSRCPRECRMHGWCDEREGCVCFPGFTGPECVPIPATYELEYANAGTVEQDTLV